MCACHSLHTLKSLIEEHARLDFSNFISTLLAIFHVINKKFHPARLLIYSINKQAGWPFFQPCSFIPFCSSIREEIIKVSKFQKQIFLFSFEPKNEQNYFLISALASKNGLNQKNERLFIILIRGYLYSVFNIIARYVYFRL